MKLTKEQIEFLTQARRYAIKAEHYKDILLKSLEKYDLQSGKGICGSSDNTLEAINCYIDYGEGSIFELISLIENCKEEK